MKRLEPQAVSWSPGLAHSSAHAAIVRTKVGKASALPTPVLNELASIPYMETLKCFAEQVEDMKVVLARHDAAIAWHTMGTELFAAIDAILSAEGGDLQAAIERLRAIRTGMQLH